MADTTPTHIHSMSRYSPAAIHANFAGLGPVSTAWPTANLCIYVPFSLPWTYTVRRLFWANGTAVAGNGSIGLYKLDGTSLYTGASVAQTGTDSVQYTTLASPAVLSQGNYFIGLAMSSTGSIYSPAQVVAGAMKLMGLFEQTSAFPVPASMTPAAYTRTFFPLVGMTRTASGY